MDQSFISANRVRDCATCKGKFSELFRLPEVWWSEWCKRLNGYFGCETTAGADGNPDGLSMSPHPTVISTNNAADTWFRFLVKRTLSEGAPTRDQKDYEWVKLNVFTRWNSATKKTIVVAFDAKPTVQQRLRNLQPNGADVTCLGNPFFIHTLLVEVVVDLQEDAVWKIRNSVRRVEEKRAALGPVSHDLARHAIHVFETLDLATRTLNSIIEHHDRFTSTLKATDRTVENTPHHICDRLRFFREAIEGLRLRSISNKERLQNEIQFSFNVVAQNINRAVQSDSSAMKTVALFTVAFYPMPFFASFFSMTFFVYNSDSNTWVRSDRLWVYWAVSLPLACMLAVISYNYNRVTASRNVTRCP